MKSGCGFVILCIIFIILTIYGIIYISHEYSIDRRFKNSFYYAQVGQIWKIKNDSLEIAEIFIEEPTMPNIPTKKTLSINPINPHEIITYDDFADENKFERLIKKMEIYNSYVEENKQHLQDMITYDQEMYMYKEAKRKFDNNKKKLVILKSHKIKIIDINKYLLKIVVCDNDSTKGWIKSNQIIGAKNISHEYRNIICIIFVLALYCMIIVIIICTINNWKIFPEKYCENTTCIFKNEDGSTCNKKPASNSQYCTLHRPQCKFIKKDGEKCKNYSIDGYDFCSRHIKS